MPDHLELPPAAPKLQPVVESPESPPDSEVVVAAQTMLVLANMAAALGIEADHEGPILFIGRQVGVPEKRGPHAAYGKDTPGLKPSEIAPRVIITDND